MTSRRRVSGVLADDASTKTDRSKASFFLFGARETGKTTWILQHFEHAARYDLLWGGKLVS